MVNRLKCEGKGLSIPPWWLSRAISRRLLDSEAGITGVKVITTVGEMTFPSDWHIQVIPGVHQYSYDQLSFPNFMKLLIDFSS